MTFRKAEKADLPQVGALYTAAIGTEGCTWNRDYPGEMELQGDFAAGCLYVLTEGAEIIGAASVIPENELDGLDCWEVTDGGQREIARVVIAAGYRGRGLAEHMLRQLFALLEAGGCSAVRLAVACGNGAAMRTYEKLDFAFLREHEMYGNRYWLCEKKF